MALPGEIDHGGDECPDCHVVMQVEVLRSAAGHYLGTECNCGPNSRETGYFRTREEAEAALAQWQQGDRSQARSTDFTG